MTCIISRDEYFERTRVPSRKAVSIEPSKRICILANVIPQSYIAVRTDDGVYFGITDQMYFKLDEVDFKEVEDDAYNSFFISLFEGE